MQGAYFNLVSESEKTRFNNTTQTHKGDGKTTRDIFFFFFQLTSLFNASLLATEPLVRPTQAEDLNIHIKMDKRKTTFTSANLSAVSTLPTFPLLRNISKIAAST